MRSFTAYIMLTLILESISPNYQSQHDVHIYTKPECNLKYKLGPNSSNPDNLLLAS